MALASPASTATATSSIITQEQRRVAFTTITFLFFLWGFMTVFNDILIPRFKEAFQLSYFQAMLVQAAFFGAYFVGSLVYFLVSVIWGDPLSRFGYKNGIVLGLLVSALGSALFWPAALFTSYPLFLVGLFVVGIGFAFLQIAANPYVTILGPEDTASSRLNLAQGFNSVGTALGPIIGGLLIFGYFSRTGAHGAESVKIPYAVFSACFLALAVAFFFIPLPTITGDGKAASSGAAALKFPHLVLGIVAIFMYVGGEVSVGSAIINFLGQKNVAGLTEIEASRYVSLFWTGLLIGRFMGAVELSDLAPQKKRAFLALFPAAALLLLWLVRGQAIALSYAPFLALAWLLFRFCRGNPGLTLFLFSSAAAALLAVALVSGGKLAMWCVVGVGLFTSIGWSNTFSLAIEGLGAHKGQASSLLVMAICGGALLPPLQGWIADATKIEYSFVVPFLAYAYVAYYGLAGHRIGRKDLALSSHA